MHSLRFALLSLLFYGAAFGCATVHPSARTPARFKAAAPRGVIAQTAYGVRFIPQPSPPANCVAPDRLCAWANASDNRIYQHNPDGTDALMTLPAPIPSWTLLTLANGWTAAGAPFAPPSYLRDQLGFVHLRGVMTTTGTIGSPAFTLPPGLRPAAATSLVIGVDAVGALGQLVIKPDGTAALVSGSAGNTSLDGIVFLGEQ
jgi:hypothetical protein